MICGECLVEMDNVETVTVELGNGIIDKADKLRCRECNATTLNPKGVTKYMKDTPDDALVVEG